MVIADSTAGFLLGAQALAKEHNIGISQRELVCLIRKTFKGKYAVDVSQASVQRILKRNRLTSTVKKRKATKASAPVVKRRQRVKHLVDRVVSADGTVQPEFGSVKLINQGLNHLFPHDPTKPVSREIIRRDLKAIGYVNRVRRRVPTRDPAVEKKRLGFTRKYLNLKTCLILFSDEHMLDRNDKTCRTQWVPSKRQGNIIPKKRAKSWNVDPVMVWGCMGNGFKSELIVFPTNKGKGKDEEKWSLNADKYQRLCLQPMIKALIEKGLHRKRTFMQDGARCHTANKVKDYLRRKNLRFIEDWPPHSPDMNPIEHVWAEMDRYVARHFPRDRDEVVFHAKQFWETEMTPEKCKRYAQNFIADVQRVHKNGGKA